MQAPVQGPQLVIFPADVFITPFGLLNLPLDTWSPHCAAGVSGRPLPGSPATGERRGGLKQADIARPEIHIDDVRRTAVRQPVYLNKLVCE